MELEPSQNSILRISDEKTLQLIISYGQEPSLWNTTLDSYKNKELRAAAARRIATELNVPHFTARHVMMKFKNLRNSYCQELKKIASSLEDGCTGEEVYRPKVFWFHHMDSYLRPHLQPTRTKLIVDQMTGEWPEKPVAACRTIEIKEEVSEADSDSNLHEDWVVQQPELIPEVATHYSDDDQPQHKRPRKSRTITQSPSTASQADSLRSIAASLQQLSTQRDHSDHFESFGRYVASALRAMEPHRALALQPRLVQLITAEMMPHHHDNGSHEDDS